MPGRDIAFFVEGAVETAVGQRATIHVVGENLGGIRAADKETIDIDMDEIGWPVDWSHPVRLRRPVKRPLAQIVFGTSDGEALTEVGRQTERHFESVWQFCGNLVASGHDLGIDFGGLGRRRRERQRHQTPGKNEGMAQHPECDLHGRSPIGGPRTSGGEVNAQSVLAVP